MSSLVQEPSNYSPVWLSGFPVLTWQSHAAGNWWPTRCSGLCYPCLVDCRNVHPGIAIHFSCGCWHWVRGICRDHSCGSFTDTLWTGIADKLYLVSCVSLKITVSFFDVKNSMVVLLTNKLILSFLGRALPLHQFNQVSCICCTLEEAGTLQCFRASQFCAGWFYWS